MCSSDLNLEPFGQDRDNIHAGIISSVIANVMGGKRRKFSPKDFMLYDKERKRQSETQGFMAGLRAFAKRVTPK